MIDLCKDDETAMGHDSLIELHFFWAIEFQIKLICNILREKIAATYNLIKR